MTEPRPADTPARARWVPIGAIGAAVILLGAGGWAFRFKYDRFKERPVRINRFTGATDIFTPAGWLPVDPPESETASTISVLPRDEMARLDGKAKVTSYGWIEAEIYNGSAFSVQGLTIRVSLPGGTREREYELFCKSSSVQPKTVGTFHADAGFRLPEGERLHWSIVSATGRSWKDASLHAPDEPRLSKVTLLEAAADGRGQNIYKAELSDGRVITLSSGHKPSEQDVLTALRDYREQGKPDSR